MMKQKKNNKEKTSKMETKPTLIEVETPGYVGLFLIVHVINFLTI
jgi:hypothetical protein